MGLKVDLHIHSALSPCGSEDMTPNNIVNMSLIKGLDVIGITDHNSCKNAGACINASENKDIIVIPGMELQTREDIHVVCLFQSLNEAMLFQDCVYHHLPKLNNKTDIFGEQVILDHRDNIIGYEDRMLLTSADISFDEAFYQVNSLGGVFIPAHIDKEGFSLLINLGFVPEYLNIKYLEYFSMKNIEHFIKCGILNKKYNFIKSSDAHYLYDIMECEEAYEMDVGGVSVDIIQIFKHLKK